MIVEFAARALEDLHDIAAYFDLISFSAGDRVIDQIEARCRSLATYPRRGTRLSAAAPREFRRLLEARYVMIYEVTPEAIRVACLLHGARDIDGAIGDDLST